MNVSFNIELNLTKRRGYLLIANFNSNKQFKIERDSCGFKMEGTNSRYVKLKDCIINNINRFI